MPAQANAQADNPSDNLVSISCNKTAGAPPRKPTTLVSRPSCPLAAINCSSPSTTVGIIADRDTPYVLASTNDRNASGNNASEFSHFIMAINTIARINPTRHTVMRRPPGNRSMYGPIIGASTAKGARLMAKNRMTFERAASGLIDKKSESAKETASAASPTTISTCTRDSRVRGLTGARPVCLGCVAMRSFSHTYSQAHGW